MLRDMKLTDFLRDFFSRVFARFERGFIFTRREFARANVPNDRQQGNFACLLIRVLPTASKMYDYAGHADSMIERASTTAKRDPRVLIENKTMTVFNKNIKISSRYR